MGVMRIRRSREDLPEWELDGNSLIVRVKSEAAFLSEFEEMFWQLMHSEKSVVTLDISRCKNLKDDAYRMIALELMEIGDLNKDLIIRVPEDLARLFEHAQLHRVAEIECVKLLGEKDSKEQAQQTVIKAVEQIGRDMQEVSGKYDSKQSDISINKDTLTTILKDRLKQQIKAQKERMAALKSVTAPLPRTGKGQLTDRRTGQIVEINKNPTVIGRVPGNDIVIGIPLVSRQHAKITYDKNQYYIEDTNSSNGTYVNSIRIDKKQSLHDGARIQIAITNQYPNGAKEYTFRQDKS
ncbi:MAG: FHA domain-containing protein [Planctomycetes bacterium]|nr:FHA domain-containing protein [Planctomycetota bacterium]